MSQKYAGTLKTLKITYVREREVSNTACKIELESRDGASKSRSLEFFGVRELEFRQSSFGVTSVELSVVDVSDRQFEDLRYEVFDEESQAISLSARSFKVT